MKIWKTVLFLPVSFFLLFPSISFAHPGRTASDGCHYCRTNCASWGEVQGARHCHGGYTAPAPIYTDPTTKPTVKPIVKPTVVPTIKPTLKPTPTPTIVPTSSPAIKGTSTETSPSPSPVIEGASDESGSAIGGLVGGATLLVGGYFGLKWLARITAPKEDSTPPPTD